MNEFESKLAKYLFNIVEEEISVEILRKVLARNQDFELYSTFKRFDRSNKNFVSLSDLKVFFEEKNIDYSDFSARQLIRQYDKDNDFVLNFEEFINILLIKSDPKLRAIVTQRDPFHFPENDFLDNKIEYELGRLLAKELCIIDNFFEIATSIKLTKDFNVYQAFRSIDYLNSNYIDEKGLNNFLNKHGYNLKSQDLNLLMSRLDRDRDGVVSYDEFKEIFFLIFPPNYNKSSAKNDKLQVNMTTNEIYDINNDNHMIQIENNKEELKNTQTRLDETNLQSNFISKVNFNLNTSTLKGNFSPLRDTYGKLKPKSLSIFSPPIRNTEVSNLESNLQVTNSKHNKPILSEKNDINISLDEKRYKQINDFNRISGQLPSKSYNYEAKNISHLITSPNNKVDFKPSTSPRNKRIYEINSKNKFCYVEKCISNECEGMLVKYLKELIEFELRLENIKESFSLKPDVRIKELFVSFDTGETGYVNPYQFKEILQTKLDIYIDNEDIKLLFKKYDRDYDSKLSYPEFCELFLPKRQEYARLIKERITRSGKSISIDSKLILIKLLKSLLEGEKSIEMSRKALANKKLFSSYDQFDMIKKKYRNFITKEDLNNFLQLHSIFTSQFELDILFDRFDFNRDGRITFNKFIHETLPRSD